MGLLLNASESGSGEPLAILHGLFGSGRNWAGIAQSLAKTYRVFCIDLRNHGGSPWAQAMTYPAMADDIRGFLLERGIDRAAILGHSMGGKAAMALALHAPALVSRLIVADIAPIPYKPALRAYADAMRALDLAALENRAAADQALSTDIPEPAIRGFLLQNLVRDGDRWRWRLNLDVLSAEMDTICGVAGIEGEPPYTGPTLFLRGENSDYVRPAAEAAIRTLFPAAGIETIPGAGHWLHAEKPKEFVEIVSGWLAR